MSRWLPAACALLGVVAHAQTTPEAFFEEAGRGLRAVEEASGAYWAPHVRRSGERILAAAEAAAGHESAVVLGAGNATEIPLARLARRFDRVTLVDLDGESLEAGAATLPDELAAKVETRVVDATGFVAEWLDRSEEAVDGAGSFEQAAAALATAAAGLEPGAGPPLEPADLVVSSLLLSEIDRYALGYADRLVRQRFGRRLADAPEYVRIRERLRGLARVDHVAVLARLTRPGGALYFADTVARGPFEQRPDARRQAAAAVAESEAGRHLLNAAAADVERLLSRMRSPDGSAARGEALLRLLCRERFPVVDEIAAFEILLARRRETFEELLDFEAVAAELEEAGFQSVGELERWFWIEHPCSVGHRSGAFEVRSGIWRR